jgi:outer membrane receptor protein involved in Fe transport
MAIAIAAHVLAGLVIFVWAAKTGRLDPVLRWLDIVPTKKEEPKEQPKPKEQLKPAEQQVPSTTPPPPGTPARPATMTAPNPNAPPAAGPSFFTAQPRPPGQTNPPTSVVPGGTGTNTAPAAPKMATVAPPVAPPPSPPPPPPPKPAPPITAARPATIAAVLEERKKAATVSDAIGAEQIARTGASDAGEIVAKVTGTSVVEGKFMVVRGLSDRYNNTTLNGAELPSADPYRKAAQVDLFNASQIDKIVTTKTFTPDQRGDFTGGAVNIVTKSFPEKRFLTLSLGTSCNTQASLNDRFLMSRGGDLDWAAMDDGTRALPDRLKGVPPGQVGPNSAALIGAFKNTQFAPTRGTSPLNQSYAFSLGDTVNFLGRPFGWFVGGNYAKNYSFYENGINSRYDSRLSPRTQFTDTRAIEDATWGTVVNLAWAPGPDHEFGFNFLHNQSGEDMARVQQGRDFTTGNDPATITHVNTIHYTGRHLGAFQFKGRHNLPWLGDARLDWLTSLANTTQDEPDLRYFNYYSAPDGQGGKAYYFDNSLPAPNRPTRYYRNLEEANQNTRLDLTLPFQPWDGREAQLKLGAFQSRSERQFNERTFTYDGTSGWDTVGDPNRYLDNLATREIASPFGNQAYTGKSGVSAAYMMVDMPLWENWRLLAGARRETTAIRVTNNGVDSKPLEADDTLPAAGVVWQPRADMNLRLNYGRTLARPTFREIANYEGYDPSGDEIFVGNPDLQRTLINNYDIRWEWFPRPGEVVTVGGFYKQLEAPIEKYLRTLDGGKISYINRDKATVYGLELEARKRLDFLDPSLAHISIGGNFAYIQSEVPLTPVEHFNKQSTEPSTPATRPLYDQSPYILNLDLNYDNPRAGTSATLQLNMTGERIYIALGKGPDIYEQPPTTLDFVLTQKIAPRASLKFTAKNLTNPVFMRTYGADPQGQVYSANRKGRTFGLALSLDF